ncbi:unnamed protein product, partial [Allacma fusca]
QKLEAELKTKTKLSKLEEEKDELMISMARLEMQTKLNKLKRDEEIAQTVLEVEKCRLEEAENESEEESQKLSSDESDEYEDSDPA